MRTRFESEQFSFAQALVGMEALADAGTLLARDGEWEVRTAYDDGVLIMPSRRLTVGSTAVRLERFLN